MILPLLTTSSGKAVLAFRTPEEQDEIIAQQHSLLGAPPMPAARLIKAELAQGASKGYVTSMDTQEAGVSSVAVPLFDVAGRSIAGCSVTFPTARRSDEMIRNCVAALFQHAPSMTERLGGIVPETVQALWAKRPQPMEPLT